MESWHFGNGGHLRTREKSSLPAPEFQLGGEGNPQTTTGTGSGSRIDAARELGPADVASRAVSQFELEDFSFLRSLGSEASGGILGAMDMPDHTPWGLYRVKRPQENGVMTANGGFKVELPESDYRA
jgi:hypothetical protein